MASSVASDRAVNYSLAYRAWQGAAGLLTIPLVIHMLAPVTQGYYYTFASLVALQSFFELGLSIVISVFASHEWHRLGRDSSGVITGDPASVSRLVSLGRFVFAYFGLAALAFLLIAGGSGFYVLGRGGADPADWELPWLLQIVLSAATLWMMPHLSLLEGCNRVADVAKFRLLQSVISNLALWGGLAAGLQLWALPLFSGVSLALLLMFLAVTERRFFSMFLRKPSGETLKWKEDLLPMQWRLAIQGLFSYLSFPLFTIIVYMNFGAVEAGRMGMTLQIMSGIQSFALVFLIARAPEFALLAASGQRPELSARVKQAALRCAGVMVALCTVVIGMLAIATFVGVPQVTRVLGIGTIALFSIGILLTSPIQAIAVFLRAHKRELLTAVGVVGGVLYGSAGWLSALAFGSFGMAASYLLVTGIVVLPLTLRVLKSHHANSSSRG